jgi:hypothetical protein
MSRRPRIAGVPKPKESEVLRAVIACLAIYGIDVQRQNTGAGTNPSGRLVRFGKKGNPDLTGTIPGTGRRIEVEVKAPGKTPRPEQLQRLIELNRQGAVAFWVDDARQVHQVLRRILEGQRVEIDPETGQQWLVSPEDPWTPGGEDEE